MPFITEGNRSTGAQWEFDKQDCLDWYEKYQDQLLEEKAQREEENADEDNSEIVKARIKKLEVETQRLELRLQRERGELVPIEDVARIVEQQYAMVKAHLLALPNKLAPIVAGQTDIPTIDSLLTSYVTEALAELSIDAVITEEQADADQDNSDQQTVSSERAGTGTEDTTVRNEPPNAQIDSV
jgi:hypothetical protein